MNIEVLLDYFFEKEVVNSNNKEVSIGDKVVVSIEGNLYSGVVCNTDVHKKTKSNLMRSFNEKDFDSIENNEKDSNKALKEAKKLKEELKLDMNFVDCYYTFDRKQLYFLYVSDDRVDFRKLAKSLADKYKTRIELRQIGVRDKSKRIGGIGPCGLQLCCNSFLTDFNSVSINMAKNQFLALNPTKINGVCGRLLCCLNYENETYSREKQDAPKIGSMIDTKKGKGKVISVDVIKHTCKVEIDERNVVEVDYKEKKEDKKKNESS